MSYQIRSISFPARSQHPIIARIETELTKLHDHSISSSSTKAESIFYSLSRLEELHDCMDEILALQSTRRALSNAQSSLLDSLLEASLTLLDVCSSSRDAMLGIKEHVQDLQTIMRRRRSSGANDSNQLNTIISNYTCFRKRMKKEAKRNIMILKQVEHDLELEGSMPSHPDQQLVTLIRGVKDVILTNASIFESLLTFISSQDSKTKSKWSRALASRLKTKGRVSSSFDSNASANELGQLDAELCKNGCCMEVSDKIQTANVIVDGMESSLERAFRCLIKTRASLLNIRSWIEHAREVVTTALHHSIPPLLNEEEGFGYKTESKVRRHH